MIMDGELDHIPEAAFNLKGTIEDAIEDGEKMLFRKLGNVFGNYNTRPNSISR